MLLQTDIGRKRQSQRTQDGPLVQDKSGVGGKGVTNHTKSLLDFLGSLVTEHGAPDILQRILYYKITGELSIVKNTQLQTLVKSIGGSRSTQNLPAPSIAGGGLNARLLSRIMVRN